MGQVTLKMPSRVAILMVLPVVLGILVGSYFLLPGFRASVDGVLALLSSGNQKALQAWVAGLGFWGPLTIVALMIAQTLLSAVPMALVMVISVLAYGPVWGALIGSIGALIAAIVGYSLARFLGPVTVDRFLSAELRQKIEEPVRRYGAWSIIALRLTMLVPTDSINFVAGLVKMPFGSFVLATAAGIAPVAAVIAYLGADLSRLGPGLVVITVLSLSALVGFIAFDWLRRKRAMGGSSG